MGENLFNAYYPVIISGFTIIICFWAEVRPAQSVFSSYLQSVLCWSYSRVVSYVGVLNHFVPHINQLHVTVIEEKREKISQVTVVRTFREILVKDKPKRNTK